MKKINFLPVRLVKVDDIIVDSTYQRPLVPEHVKAIVKNFNPDFFSPLRCVKRTDGKIAVVDGQHRLAAVKVLGIEKVQCTICSAMPLTKEAQYFTILNKNQWKPSSIAIYHSNRAAKEPVTLNIDKIMAKHGLVVGGYPGPKNVSCPTLLQEIYNNYGAESLDEAMGVITETWPGDKTALAGKLIHGLSFFLHVCKKHNMEFKRNGLTRRLEREKPARILSEIKGRSGTNQSSVAHVIAQIYNKGLHGKSTKLKVGHFLME